MKLKHITALLASSAIALTLTGCIHQTLPKLAYLQAVSSLGSTVTYEKTSTTDLDIVLHGTFSEEKQELLNLVNEGTFRSTSVFDANSGVTDSTFSMESKVGALPINLTLPISLDESNQKVSIQLDGVAQTLSDYIPVPPTLHEKTLILPFTNTAGEVTAEKAESLLYTELVAFAKALPETKFVRLDRTEDEKQAKVRDKIALTLTDEDIKGFLRTVLNKSELSNESKTALQKHIATWEVATLTLTVTIDKEGVLMGEERNIRLLQKAAPQANSWSIQSASIYTPLEEHTSTFEQPKPADVVTVTDMLQMISTAQSKEEKDVEQSTE